MISSWDYIIKSKEAVHVWKSEKQTSWKKAWRCLLNEAFPLKKLRQNLRFESRTSDRRYCGQSLMSRMIILDLYCDEPLFLKYRLVLLKSVSWFNMSRLSLSPIEHTAHLFCSSLPTAGSFPSQFHSRLSRIHQNHLLYRVDSSVWGEGRGKTIISDNIKGNCTLCRAFVWW